MQDRHEERPRGQRLPRALRLPVGEARTPAEDRDEADRERARRALIYEDMVRRAGRILWHDLAAWDYQPTEGEVAAAIAEAQSRRGTGGRAFYRKRAAAEAQAGRKAS